MYIVEVVAPDEQGVRKLMDAAWKLQAQSVRLIPTLDGQSTQEALVLEFGSERRGEEFRGTAEILFPGLVKFYLNTKDTV